MNWSRQRKSYALYHQENEVRKSPKLSNSLRGKKKVWNENKTHHFLLLHLQEQSKTLPQVLLPDRGVPFIGHLDLKPRNCLAQTCSFIVCFFSIIKSCCLLSLYKQLSHWPSFFSPQAGTPSRSPSRLSPGSLFPSVTLTAVPD